MQPRPPAVVPRDRPVLSEVAAARAGEAGPQAEENCERDEVPHGEESEAVDALVERRVREDKEAPRKDGRTHGQQRVLTHARGRRARGGPHHAIGAEACPPRTCFGPRKMAHATSETHKKQGVRRGRSPSAALPRGC